ncbi:hypothetical protein KSP40_PGU003340 [Platanthera guangdongensis]|uniref:RIN4 pathogenic type III effector avirulence factor Avr cleavage site domain-containing protein n=1 Tax=Platanthera guangdongensis TaxID=2320717 RepID=A0ABR2MNF6_9ASPA
MGCNSSVRVLDVSLINGMQWICGAHDIKRRGILDIINPSERSILLKYGTLGLDLLRTHIKISNAQVPKFGNWEEKDIPYTKCFEDALKKRAAGFNPNDPEDNPEADSRNRPEVMQQQTSSHRTDKQAHRSSTLSMNRDTSLQRSSSSKVLPHEIRACSFDCFDYKWYFFKSLFYLILGYVYWISWILIFRAII